jgi:hypothetical protein
VIIDFEGRRYEFDLDDVGVRQAEKIEAHVGGPLMDFQMGLATASVKSLQALYWFITTSGNVDVPIATMDFHVIKFSRVASDAMAAAEAATEAAEPAADPTMPASSVPSPEPASTPAPEAGTAVALSPPG